MTDPRLARLVQMAALLRDRRLAELAAASARLDAVDARLAALAVTPVLPDDLVQARAADRHARWAAIRRADLVVRRAPLSESRDAAAAQARRALARADLLARLARKGGDQLS